MFNKKRKFIVLANMSNFRVEGLKTKALLAELMKISVGNQYFYRTGQIDPDPETRWHIMESSQKAGQTGVKFVVSSLEEANAKVLKLKKELFDLTLK